MEPDPEDQIQDQIQDSDAPRSDLESTVRMLRRLVDLQDRHRSLIAHDVHDGLVQDIVAARMFVESAICDVAANRDPDDVVETLRSVTELLDQALAQGRRLAQDLKPTSLSVDTIGDGLERLVEQLRRQSEAEIVWSGPSQWPQLDAHEYGILFHILKESLTNAVRHSQGKRIQARIGLSADQLTVDVRDDGIGIDLSAISPDRMGLSGIRERVGMLGGETSISSDGGTHIRILIPIEKGRP